MKTRVIRQDTQPGRCITNPQLLLELLDKRFLDLLKVREQGKRDHDHNRLAAAVNLDLASRADVERSELLLQLRVSLSDALDLCRDTGLDGRGGGAVLLDNLASSCLRWGIQESVTLPRPLIT